jgi:RimJ/RimL family protein N-acetyltransferase
MTPGPTLETPRLILRPPEQGDFDAWAAMHAEEDTMRHIGGVCSRDAAWRNMASQAGSWRLLGFGMFSVLERQGGRWIGRVGPLRPGGRQGGWPGDEVGWAMSRAGRGKGYAAEAAAAAMEWAFDQLGWQHIIHCIDKTNAASIVLAERLGSRRLQEDVAMPAPFEMLKVDIYGQSKVEWRARNDTAATGGIA